jgi:hypothetical protein
MRTISLIMCVTVISVTIYVSMPNACMICVPYPKTTLADVLSESESVIFAREKIGKPYFFRIVKVLKRAMTV